MTIKKIFTATSIFTIILTAGCATAHSDRDIPNIEKPYATVQEARAALESLSVKGKSSKADYKRVEQFGKPWTDDNTAPLGHNGCDTRNDILNRDITNKVNREIHNNNNHSHSYGYGKRSHRSKRHNNNNGSRSSTSCHVVSGTLNNPYTGQKLHFTQCQYGKVCDIQIDHIVPLANAWQTGAKNLTQEQRIALANDPRNLLAVDRVSNDKKSDNDASGWLPKNRGFWCTYIEKQIWVKKNYHLWVTPAEKHTMITVLTRYCTINTQQQHYQ